MIKISNEEFRILAAYIKENYGIALKDEKKDLLVGRLYNVLDELKMNSFSEYYKYLINDQTGQAANVLVDRITTNHTYFMREFSHFDVLKQQVLPYWKNRIQDKDLRIWCAACSSGEEAYTLAMIVDEFLGESKRFWDAKILATDISRQILEKAQAGVYKEEAISKLPLNWQKFYFKKVGDQFYAVDTKLKDEVIFRQFNLIAPSYPFRKGLHVIFCRNVMIYFDDVTRREVINKFYEALEPGGYLFIGKSESLGNQTNGFKYICPSIYQKV